MNWNALLRRATRGLNSGRLVCLTLVVVPGLVPALVPALAQAEPAAADAAASAAAPADPAEESVSVHGQFTSTTQKHPGFNAPYAGPNSLHRTEPALETVDLTLFLGARLWRGGAIYVDPEIDQGYGLTNTLGVAGFPSGEAYKVGNWTPYYRTPRIFLRQVLALGSQQGPVESAPNSLAGLAPEDNLTLTVGKFSVVDIFDTNVFAHDPRADFLNWSVIESGAFDYAADSWGYTLGEALEWRQGDWTWRQGFFALSTEPNAESLDTRFKQHSLVFEVERRFSLGSRPGAIRLLGYTDQGRIARYDDAVALALQTHASADVGRVRHEATKSGWALNLEQDLGGGVGGFARLSANDGQHEAFDFTDINQALSAGLVFQGDSWHRAGDVAGIAFSQNGLSGVARAYFAAGGLGILIGDGQLPHYGAERIVEAYYQWRPLRPLSLAVDFQSIANPAYNRDRGPVQVVGVRAHAEF
jgi:high affinity Mn2+ porin